MEDFTVKKLLDAYPDFAVVYNPLPKTVQEALLRTFKVANESTRDAILGYLSTSPGDPPSPEEILNRIIDMQFGIREGVGRRKFELGTAQGCFILLKELASEQKCDIDDLLNIVFNVQATTTSFQPVDSQSTEERKKHSALRRDFVSLLHLAGDQDPKVSFRNIRTRYRKFLRQQQQHAAAAAAAGAHEDHVMIDVPQNLANQETSLEVATPLVPPPVAVSGISSGIATPLQSQMSLPEIEETYPMEDDFDFDEFLRSIQDPPSTILGDELGTNDWKN